MDAKLEQQNVKLRCYRYGFQKEALKTLKHHIYRARKNGLYVVSWNLFLLLFSVQEQISPNHVQAIFSGSVWRCSYYLQECPLSVGDLYHFTWHVVDTVKECDHFSTQKQTWWYCWEGLRRSFPVNVAPLSPPSDLRNLINKTHAMEIRPILDCSEASSMVHFAINEIYVRKKSTD